MSDTRILQKVPGAVGRYTFGAFKFNASCDKHAERMKDAYLRLEARKSEIFQFDPLTPQQRLKLGPVEAELQAAALDPGYPARERARKQPEAKKNPPRKEKKK